MLAVDTNVLVRLIVRDDVAQVRAAEKFIAKGAWISHLVLAETICVLNSVYDLPHEKIATAVDMLLNHGELSLQDADAVAAALLQFQAHSKVDFSDCLVLAIAKKAGHVPLGTFDRDFSKLVDVERIS
jgi:predicted nucleic-acid-binding protein